jgi:hypothetical protein
LAIVSFANQVAGLGASVPDAAITASCRYLFEIKTARGAVGRSQILSHLEQLDGSYRDERLFVITPDPAEPPEIRGLQDSKVVWFNFLALSQAIDELLSDPTELMSEQAQFLLRELQALFGQDSLLDYEDTVVVAARNAWPEYQRYGAYVCQPGRSFRGGLVRMAFYADGAIKPLVPRIVATRPSVSITRESADQLDGTGHPEDACVANLIRRLLSDDRRAEATISQIFLLSSPGDETLKLPGPVRNSAVDRNGQPCAWVQGQCYTRSELLMAGPATTGELEAPGG